MRPSVSETDKAPRWVAVRNVSDPQIKAEGTLRQQAALAAQIHQLSCDRHERKLARHPSFTVFPCSTTFEATDGVC